jgi:hypothetical protein
VNCENQEPTVLVIKTISEFIANLSKQGRDNEGNVVAYLRYHKKTQDTRHLDESKWFGKLLTQI